MRRTMMLILFLWVCVWCPSVHAQAEHIFEITAPKPPSKDRGISEDDPLSQTAFRVKGKPGLITALHGVVYGAVGVPGEKQKSYVSAGIGKERYTDLQIVEVDIERDLARMSSKELDAIPVDGLEVAEQVDWRTIGTICVVGHPHGIGHPIQDDFLAVRRPNPIVQLFKIVDGETAYELTKRNSPDPKTEVVSLQGFLGPGHSGAPILDANKRVIAVGNGGLKAGTVGQGWAIPINKVQWVKMQPEVLEELKALAKKPIPGLFAEKAEPAL